MAPRSEPLSGVLVEAASNQRWRARAACAGADLDLFFPLSDGPWGQSTAATAKEICQSCEVRATCLQWATETGQQHGIFGGLTAAERAVIRRRAVSGERTLQVASTGAAGVADPL